MTASITIVSGGQTGADRAALDAALACGAACGGWCPADRMAEDGPISPRYPLTPLAAGGYRERTRKNVEHSDATVIFCQGTPQGGTRATLDDCRALGKPHLVIDPAAQLPAQAAAAIAGFLRRHAIRVLNVAGPRASQQPQIYEFVRAVVQQVLSGDGPSNLEA